MYLTHGILFELNFKEQYLIDDGNFDILTDALRARGNDIIESFSHVHDGYEFKDVIYGRTDRDRFIQTYTDLIDDTVGDLKMCLARFLKSAGEKGIGSEKDFIINEDSIMRLLTKPNDIMNAELCKVCKIASGEYCAETYVFYPNFNSGAADEKYIHRIYDKPEIYALAIYSIHR